jgi:hypothetical protein
LGPRHQAAGPLPEPTAGLPSPASDVIHADPDGSLAVRTVPHRREQQEPRGPAGGNARPAGGLVACLACWLVRHPDALESRSDRGCDGPLSVLPDQPDHGSRVCQRLPGQVGIKFPVSDHLTDPQAGSEQQPVPFTAPRGQQAPGNPVQPGRRARAGMAVPVPVTGIGGPARPVIHRGRTGSWSGCDQTTYPGDPGQVPRSAVRRHGSAPAGPCAPDARDRPGTTGASREGASCPGGPACAPTRWRTCPAALRPAPPGRPASAARRSAACRLPPPVCRYRSGSALHGRGVHRRGGGSAHPGRASREGPAAG